jgi:DNA-binding GntR family transcriptional regulator
MNNDSLCEKAYRYIFDRIVNFDLKPNDPIIENDISRDLALSRTPLREALRRLEADGLVYKVKNRGTYVRGFSYDDIVEISELRILFETYSLKHCVELVSESEIAAVRAKLDALTDTSPNDQYYESDIAIHKMIVNFCMNSRMVAFLNSLNSQLEVFRLLSAQIPKRLIFSRREHIEILNAIAAKDLDTANQKLLLHLENVKNNTILFFKRMKMDFPG